MNHKNLKITHNLAFACHARFINGQRMTSNYDAISSDLCKPKQVIWVIETIWCSGRITKSLSDSPDRLFLEGQHHQQQYQILRSLLFYHL